MFTDLVVWGRAWGVVCGSGLACVCAFCYDVMCVRVIGAHVVVCVDGRACVCACGYVRARLWVCVIVCLHM